MSDWILITSPLECEKAVAQCEGDGTAKDHYLVKIQI